MREVVRKQWVNRFDVAGRETQLAEELAKLEAEINPVTNVVKRLSKKIAEAFFSKWFGR
jgi:hypothetical protein